MIGCCKIIEHENMVDLILHSIPLFQITFLLGMVILSKPDGYQLNRLKLVENFRPDWVWIKLKGKHLSFWLYVVKEPIQP